MKFARTARCSAAMLPAASFQRRARHRLLARLQPLDLQDDHRLAERVALLVGRHLDARERHVPGPGDLDEERVGRSHPRLAGTAIGRHGAIDERVARLELQLRRRQRRLDPPRLIRAPAPASPAAFPSVNENCSPVPDTIV